MKIGFGAVVLLGVTVAGAAKWVPSGSDWTLTSGPVGVRVVAQVGRVLEFSWRGRNMLGQQGSMFYPAPQSAFPNTWPPPQGFAFDNAFNFSFTLNADSTVLLARAPQAGTGTSLLPSRKYSFDEATGTLTTEYGIKNTSASATTGVAPWEVTRVPPASLLFFPDGGAATVTFSMNPIVPAKIDSMIWLKGTTSNPQAKYFRGGKGGWLAQIADSVLFVKNFDDIPSSAYAPNEAEIEIYQESGFIEMEEQGAYVELAPGDSLKWSVRWSLKALPNGTSVTAGSKALIDSARSLNAQKPAAVARISGSRTTLPGPRVDIRGRILSPSFRSLLQGRLELAPIR